MQETGKQINELLDKVVTATTKLDVDAKVSKINSLNDEMQKSDFWQDSRQAQEISKQHSKLEKQVSPWLDLYEQLSDLSELAEIGDETLAEEMNSSFDEAKASYAVLEIDLKFNGKYDDYDALVSLQSGAGGTDAQDWASMLQRMYVRWAERNDLKVELLDETSGEEAGIKSCTLAISGSFVYGKLKGEHGVHRLVRISPFNSGGTRETSFAMVEVMPQIDTPEDVDIADSDIRVDVFRASGNGGQSVNTTDSAVRITHLQTNIVVSIQNEKSQIQNRETAMKLLRSKLVQLQLEQHQEKIADLKGPSKEVTWGSQIRSYVLNPYTMVKDTRTKCDTTDVKSVLDGDLNNFIDAYLSM